MRKAFSISFILLILLTLVGASGVAAQDKVPLELGQWIEGTLTDDAYEVKYTFSGTEGQIILVEMIPKPGTYDLDPDIILRNSDGDILGQNDDFSYPLSIVVAELTADDTYTVLATRSGGKGGSSTGEYWLRGSTVDPLTPGSKLDVTITSDSDKDTPSAYVLRLDSDGAVKIGFSQKIGDLYASMSLSEWQDDSYPNAIMSLSDTAKVSAATLSVALEGGKLYILTVQRAYGSYVFDSVDATVTVTIS